jgi:hypothetical protein
MRSRLAEGVELNFCLRQAGGAPSFLERGHPVTVYLPDGQYSAKKCNKL